jgi:hypothetical protein
VAPKVDLSIMWNRVCSDLYRKEWNKIFVKFNSELKERGITVWSISWNPIWQIYILHLAGNVYSRTVYVDLNILEEHKPRPADQCSDETLRLVFGKFSNLVWIPATLIEIYGGHLFRTFTWLPYVTTASFQILLDSSLINHRTIQCCVV